MTQTREGQVMEHADQIDEIEAQIPRAERRGRDAGISAGSWIIDGNTSVETARRILAGIENDDPEILDMQPRMTRLRMRSRPRSPMGSGSRLCDRHEQSRE